MNSSPGPAVYVYCVVETTRRLRFGRLGFAVNSSPVYSVHHGNLAAIVSPTALRRCLPTRENLLAHQIVNERVSADRTAIPVAFGTILRTESDVVTLLRSTESSLVEALKALEGKVELGVGVKWADEEVASKVEGDIRARAAELTAAVQKELRPHSVASRPRTPGGDDVLLNAAFLVERAREEEFDHAVSRLRHRYEGQLDFTYTGPWPQYTFVDIRVSVRPERSGQWESESIA